MLVKIQFCRRMHDAVRIKPAQFGALGAVKNRLVSQQQADTGQLRQREKLRDGDVAAAQRFRCIPCGNRRRQGDAGDNCGAETGRDAFRRKRFALPALGACELAVSLVLFTRVQNTGSHQMLLFLPAYFLLFLAGAAALAEGIERRKALKLGYWAFTLVFAVSVRCSPLTVVALPDFLIDHFPLKSTAEFVRLDGLTCDRRDLSQLQAVTEWLSVHLGDGETAYMITDDMLYNPGHLRNCLLPEQPLDGKLPDSFSVPGTHNFPMRFFEAKYVVTVDPYPLSYASNTELGHKLNAKFAELRDGTHTLAATFDMGNGYTFTIWERIAAPTRAEVETYLHVFDAENAQYPEMFSQVAESWLAAHGL